MTWHIWLVIMNKLSVSIICPNKEVHNIKNVAAITLPGNSGDIGILPKHAPIMCDLQSGVLKVNCNNSINLIKIDSGFMHFYNNICKIMVQDYSYIDDN